MSCARIPLTRALFAVAGTMTLVSIALGVREPVGASR
jgi:hypothetical protein